MRRCPNNHAVPDDVRYCPTCGAEVTEQAGDSQQQEQQQSQQQSHQQGYQQPGYQHTDPRNIPLTGYRGQYRSPVTVLLLGIFTCGIYLIYWRYITSQDINAVLGYEKTKPSYELLGILCMIFSWINMYYIDEALVEIDNKRGFHSDSKFILWLLLTFFLGIGTLFMAYTVQERLNALYSGQSSRTAPY
ncbi:MAG: DUF4234 domain-containing protein [Eubacteriales bacterium]|nr:DUF4234 domain-containing protein [Eubacteriales bacterium]MDD4323586.1 DUF4234 domain-containing protein [Eubacteriales bacterium]MDD4541614.1 DUF4234 domain-containing protein [Eubacteriales bacterium]